MLWGACVAARAEARCGDAGVARSALAAVIERLEACRDTVPDPVVRAETFRLAGEAYTDLAILESYNFV